MRFLLFPAMSAIAGAALALAAQPAYAFCRTTTSQVPAGYDPTVNGCWTQGTPLSWHASRIVYGLGAAASQQVSLADATRVADLAFGAWNDVSCPTGAPSVYAYDEGAVAGRPDGGSCTSSADCDPQANDVILFDDTVWPYNDPTNTLALTTVTYGVDDGAIFQAYTEVNTAQNQITAQDPPPAGSAAFDLQSILTHEAGHFFGLAHAPDTTAIMYAYYTSGKVQPTTDDVDGFCTIYPPLQNPLKDSPASSSCQGAAIPSRTSSALAAPGLLFAALALAGARLRRGRRDGTSQRG